MFKLTNLLNKVLNIKLAHQCGYHMHVGKYGKYITYKGRVVKHDSYKYWDEATTMYELYQRCLHIESLELKPNIRNVARDWNEYKNLQPGIPTFTAYPWVTDDYYENKPNWRQISQQQYERHLNVVPPIAMARSGFLQGEGITYDSEGKSVYLACREQNGKYYAKLMNLDNFCIEMKQ